MCGICGVMSSYLSEYELSKFEDLMKMSLLRGEIGAGIAAVSSGKLKTTVIKTKHSSYDLIRTNEYYNLIKNRKAIMIGHARAPTIGGTDIEWVHPHRVNHIVGVHNGTLRSFDGKGIDAKKDSDSKMLINGIAKEGIEKTIEKTNGAYAMVWLDENKKTLNFLRNDERPLFFGHFTSQVRPGTLYWASDRRFLEFALGHGSTIFELPKDTWWEFPQTLNGIIPEPKATKVERKWPIVSYHGGRYHGGYYGQDFGEGVETWDEFWDDKKEKKPEKEEKKEWDNFFRTLSIKVGEEGASLDNHETTRGHFVGPAVFQHYLNKGCLNCGVIVLSDDLQNQPVKWISKNEYVCDLCSVKTPVNQIS
jgi:predicted glutamine amidotransferase